MVGGDTAGKIGLTPTAALAALEHCYRWNLKKRRLEPRRIGSLQLLRWRMRHLVDNEAGVLIRLIFPDLGEIRGVQLFVMSPDKFTVTHTFINGHVSNVMFVEKAKDRVGIRALEELTEILVALGSIVAGAPGKRGPAIEEPATGQKNGMIHEPVAKEDIVWLGILADPFDERIADHLHLDPVGVMDSEQIDRAADHDRACQRQCYQSAGDGKPERSKSPQSPDAVSDKKVTKDEPDIEILVVGQGLKTHLETKGHDIHG